MMRTILLELERIYNHVADIGAIATDVGFVVANAHAGRLREMVLSLNEAVTGSRLLRGMVCVGGVRRDWQAGQQNLLRSTIDRVEKEFRDLVALIQSSDSTRDRLERTGILRPEKARDLGIVGVGGRASGVDLDVRRDHPYAAYGQFPFRVPVYQAGDVWHRMQVRIDEVSESIDIIRAAPPNMTCMARTVPRLSPSLQTGAPSARWKAGAARSSTGSGPGRAIAWSAARSKTLRSTTGRRLWKRCRATSSRIFR